MPVLTLDHARRLIDAALAQAETADLNISVAVVDAGGHLLSLARSENANLATIDIAVQKARTSVFFKAATRHLTAAMQPGGPIYTAQLTSGGLTAIPGGVPVLGPDGTVMGGVGISGGTADQDDTIATELLA
jgi:uncharacterized protein GlcG (DUF336 family)